METLLFDRYIILLLKAVLFLAKHKDDQKYYKVKEISESLGVSKSYMARIIQSLVHNKILESSTGPTGGFYLPTDNLKLTLHDVIKHTGYDIEIEKCLMEWPECNEVNPCPLHNTWKRFRESLLKDLKQYTIEEACEQLYDRIV
ncbi:MAG: Rrf2 family transcriptional regulator [Leptospiraceae bacterium]|nr:Rrf2 family transcriptional regulator [Leptospiraceae bacterium]MDW7975643.1 Rrf2 family transcriptional regulator [Leptospiraceae bacterium]